LTPAHQADEPGNDETMTYGELLQEVSRLANVLLSRGVRKGDVRIELAESLARS
jgi:acyl-coenzyme A synthetase/AMP-(fatty) acid ligase